MKSFKIPSLILATILQVLPMARMAAIFQTPATPLWAVIFRWVGGAAAALGSIQAVSGASTKITSPLAVKGTNGVPFKLRLATAPDQANYWTASGIPGGLALQGTAGKSFWQITGTPTVGGTFNVRLTAKDQINSGADRTVSATLVLTIIDTGTPPAITAQPTSQTVSAGAQVTFTVTASGSDPKAFQWKKDGIDISAATAATYTISNAQPSDSGGYTVLVSNASGNVLSQTATLTVTEPVSPPGIRSGPSSKTVHTGESAAFSVAALGTPPLSYKWFHDGAEISGATTATLTVSNAQASDSGDYRVEVSNTAGNAQSNPATLTVTALQILTVIENGGSSVLTWNGIPGRNYSILGSTSVVGQWQPLIPAEVTVSNGVMSGAVPNANGTIQLFRVATAP